MNWNENETESFGGNFAASEEERLFFEVPLSLMRAFLVVNCQLALVWLALRSCSQAAISSMRICLLGMRRLRHWDVRTPSSDSARLSQLPCFGV